MSSDARQLLTAGIAAAGVLTALVALSKLLNQPLVLPRMPVKPEDGKAATGGLIVVAPSCGVIHGDALREFQAQLRRMSGPVDLVIHCYGGVVTVVNSMVHAIRAYPGEVKAYVPYHAFSGGTMLALACNKIIMGDSAVLGPVDPQLRGVPAATLIELNRRKTADSIDDQFHILAIEAEKYQTEARSLVESLGVTGEALERLTSGSVTHGLGVTYAEAKRLGLKVARGVPLAYYRIVENSNKPAVIRW